jgi:CheY-like chemotaxis protein
MTRILVVDDEEINLMIIEEMLKPCGYETDLA